MSFKLGNVNGKAALVKKGAFYNLSEISNGCLSVCRSAGVSPRPRAGGANSAYGPVGDRAVRRCGARP